MAIRGIAEELIPHYLAELMKVAAQLDVQVRVERLGDAETPIESGLAWVEGKAVMFLDPRLSDLEKVQVIAREISRFPTEELFLKPAIRELLSTVG
jgi:hypothetical protein